MTSGSYPHRSPRGDRGTGRPTKKDRRDIEQFFSDDYNYLLDEDDYLEED